MFFHHISILTYPLLYLDPGSGSVLIQIILAAILGIGVTTRLFWSKIKSVFSGKQYGTDISETRVSEEKDAE